MHFFLRSFFSVSLALIITSCSEKSKITGNSSSLEPDPVVSVDANTAVVPAPVDVNITPGTIPVPKPVDGSTMPGTIPVPVPGKAIQTGASAHFSIIDYSENSAQGSSNYKKSYLDLRTAAIGNDKIFRIYNLIYINNKIAAKVKCELKGNITSDDKIFKIQIPKPTLNSAPSLEIVLFNNDNKIESFGSTASKECGKYSTFGLNISLKKKDNNTAQYTITYEFEPDTFADNKDYEFERNALIISDTRQIIRLIDTSR